MVQRKVPSKPGIQADNVKSLSSSQNQDGKTRGTDMKKKMKKPKPKPKPKSNIKLSDMEILRSSSSSSPPSSKKQPPFLHVLTMSSSPPSSSSSPQKHTPLIKTSDGSPNYMKPTSSSCAKKELFPVSLRNPKTSSSKSSCVSSSSGKKPAKTLTKSSPSMKLVRTLTKVPSFKKSSRVSLCAADMNAQRATCSSTLKDSKFPPYLMLNPGATESEGTSAMKVCPYTYCSLNGHRHAPLPPLKSFLSARRRILKAQKSMKLSALSPRRPNAGPCEPKKETDNGMDFFIEVYAKKNEDEEEMGRFDSTERVEDEDIKSTMEDQENCLVTQGDDDDMKKVIAGLSDGSPESEIDFDGVEDSKGRFPEEKEAEFVAEKKLLIWLDEEMSIGSYCSETSTEMDGSNSEATDMEWEHEEDDDVDSSVLTEENDPKVESFSQSSHDVSVMWLDDIISIYYEDMLEANADERAFNDNVNFDQPYLTKEFTDREENRGENENFMDTTIMFSSNFTEKNTLDEPEESGEKNQEKDDVPETDRTDCVNMVQNETLEDGISSSLDDKVSHTSKECYELAQAETEDVALNHFKPEEEQLTDDTMDQMEKEDYADFNKQIEGTYVSYVSHDCCEADTNHGLKTSETCEVEKISEEDENPCLDNNEDDDLERSRCISDEEKNTSKKWKGGNRRKRAIQDEEEMRKFNPKEPNFLPLVPDPEAEKVDLKHQMMDERKNAEEWMLDYALRQTVTKLAQARKRKVALLVEAFEAVAPIMPKCETRMRNKSSFDHARPMQACS